MSPRGIFDINDIQTAVFEYNGKLTILPIGKKRPTNPEDLKIEPAEATIQTEVIMDGRILDENLKRMGLDKIWLKKQLDNKGYKKQKKYYFACVIKTIYSPFLVMKFDIVLLSLL